MALNIQIDQQKLATFADKWGIVELALFGSVLRDDFRADSDIDVLVSFAPHVEYTLFDLIDMEQELSNLWGRKVDLGTRRSVEQDQNYIRRKIILGSAEIIYATGTTVTPR